MFTKKSHADVKKSTLKIQDCKKDSATRLRHLKTILDYVDVEEAKSVFETNYSHVYYILYDTFVQAETNLRQRVHKAHKEELDGSLWLLGKIFCLLPELLAKRWQCHSLSRIMGKLLHPGNSSKLRKEGVRYFLLWYQALGENAPPHVHAMFAELVPGLMVPNKSGNGGPSCFNNGGNGPSTSELMEQTDFINHPNMKNADLGGSVFHDNTSVHPVQNGEILPILPPSSNERTLAPDPRDGLEILLNCMVQTTACLCWRENALQRHMKSFSFLLERFKSVYLPVFCHNFDFSMSIYNPKLELPTMRVISKKDELMSSCIVVLINWISKFTHDKIFNNNRLDNIHIDDDLNSENSSLLSNARLMGYTQLMLVRDVLYSTRDNINFVHEVYRQAFLLGFSTKSQIEAIRCAISVYRDWMTMTDGGTSVPSFLLEPEENVFNVSNSTITGSMLNDQNNDSNYPQRTQRLRNDSYLGAITKENILIRAGLQNVLQVFVTNAANVFLVNTANLNIIFPSKTRDCRSSPLNEQTDICKKVLNVYRTMVMNTRMDPKTWEQLLLVLLQITSIILNQSNQQTGSKSNSLGGRLGQAIFQTLIVTWIRAHTNVPVNCQLWEKFLNVLTSLTHRDELIIEWDKTMQTLTRVLARYVYNLNLQDLPLDRLAENKGKRRRIGSVWQQSSKDNRESSSSFNSTEKKQNFSDDQQRCCGDEISKQSINSMTTRSSPGTPSLNRSYSEGSLAPNYRKSRSRRRFKNSVKIPTLPSNVELSLNVMLANVPQEISISSETLNSTRMSMIGVGENTFRRALSLDSLHPNKRQSGNTDDDEGGGDGSRRESRTPSPTASSGIEGGSIKDSPMQIDVLAADSSSIDTQDEGNSSLNRRSIILGGTASGWLPDVAAIMWKRMLGALGDVNRIPRPELHAQVFKHLVEMTINLIKIKQNQGVSQDNQSTPIPSYLTPPIGIAAPWCYGALILEPHFKKGKLHALQLLCMLATHGSVTGMDHLSLFYNALHRTLVGEDRDMIYTILKYLEGSRFLSLLLPGHTLLLLDVVHTSAVLLTSLEVGKHTPRAEVASLLGSLLCYPSSVLPKPVLQPSAQIELMECPDLQDHVLNIILRCARREPSSKARCIALAYLAQWLLQQLSRSTYIRRNYPQSVSSSGDMKRSSKEGHTYFHPRIKEIIQVLLQAIQFKHRTIAIVASDSLKLCAERGREIAQIEKLPHLIISAICKALEIQNVTHPKESDKIVLTSLILCLGEFCMGFPSEILIEQQSNDKRETLILTVLRVLHHIASGTKTDRIKLLTADEDFDMMITYDDVVFEGKSIESGGYQTVESTQQCIAAIRLCAKAVAMHLVTHLGHFPMGIGASRLSSLVEEQDDLNLNVIQSSQDSYHNSSGSARDSIDLGTQEVLNAQNIQLFMLNSGLAASFVELPALKLPGGGVTAGLITADKQVRVLLRDLNGKACWDASILYSEPKNVKNNMNNPNEGFNIGVNFDRGGMITESNDIISRQFQIGKGDVGVSLDPLISTIGIELSTPRHTLRHRDPSELPTAKDLAPDLDQLDDLLQYIGFTSPECLSSNSSSSSSSFFLNSPGPSPLGAQLEAQTISIILNQRAIEQEYVQRQNAQILAQQRDPQRYNQYGSNGAANGNNGGGGVGWSSSSIDFSSYESFNTSLSKNDIPFHYCRLLFSHLGLAGWEKRSRTHLLKRTEKLLRELRNVDIQKCRETHKVAVIYVGSGQEDKNSILRNSYGSSTYEMFVSALGWEVELETHNGFLGGLPRTGCGATAPYYATPFLEVIYHVATRMPCDTPEAILTKTRHLGNDEVHIVWSEHYREYRRDILPTEFCDVLIVVYPLKNGLFRVTVNRKSDVPWFGPLTDECVISGACLASLVRATAINASRAKRSSLPFFQQFYEERNRSLETVSLRYKESTTFEEFISRVYNPIPANNNMLIGGGNTGSSIAPLAAALIDINHHQRTSIKGCIQNPDVTNIKDNIQSSNVTATTQVISLDNSSPKPHRKLHPFKSMPKKSLQHQQQLQQNQLLSQQQQQQQQHHNQDMNTPPESPTFPGSNSAGRRIK